MKLEEWTFQTNQERNYISLTRRLHIRDGSIRKFHYSAEAEYLMNATEAEAEAEAEYYPPFFTY